jgi:hypothetical protein
MDDQTRTALENAAKEAAHGVASAAKAAEPKIAAGGVAAKLWIAGHPQFAMGFAAGFVVGAVLAYLLVHVL